MHIQVKKGTDIYKESFLVRPSSTSFNDIVFRQSRYAILHIGSVRAGDLIINTDGLLGSVAGFWQHGDGDIFVAVDAYECVNSDPRLRALQRHHRVFFDAHTIIDSLIWVEESPAIIRVSLPPALLYK
jgi:hypothetical protein